VWGRASNKFAFLKTCLQEKTEVDSRAMKTLLLILALLTSAYPQKNQTKLSPEIKRLQEQYIAASKQYKASLMKLAPLYEAAVSRTEEKLAVSRKLLAEGLVPPTQVEENEKNLSDAKNKVVEIQSQMSEVDKEIAEASDTAKLEREFAENLKRAKAERRKQRVRPCQNWDVMISQRQTARSVSLSYKLVCR
jgi:hypothetical protein